MRAAVVQMTATGDVAHNIDRVSALIKQAAGEGATFVQTPEVTNMIPPTGDDLFRLIREEGDDETLKALRELAAELGITLHIGSLALKSEDPERAANRGFLIAPDGEVIARYDKIHMFEADLGEKGKYREGKAHWHTLLRARAIENGCFMIAAAQWGQHGGKDESAMRETYGHSLIVDPWGTVLADAEEGEGIAVADLDLDLVAKARKRIGSLMQGRPIEVVRH